LLYFQDRGKIVAMTFKDNINNLFTDTYKQKAPNLSSPLKIQIPVNQLFTGIFLDPK